jgi:branched-chain amino acid transport system ATP-binding protein
MLAVGRAILSGCRVIMLDEPSMGLAPLLMYDMFRTLRELNEEGMTILLIEQNANLALKFAHRGYVIDTGEIVARGSSAELMEDPEVKKAYLGG